MKMTATMQCGISDLGAHHCWLASRVNCIVAESTIKPQSVRNAGALKWLSMAVAYAWLLSNMAGDTLARKSLLACGYLTNLSW
jgi:hypothetical protein